MNSSDPCSVFGPKKSICCSSTTSRALARAYRSCETGKPPVVAATSSEDYNAMEAIIRREKPDFVQVDYSMDNRAAEKRILPAAADAGAAVLTATPFGRTSLFRAVKGKTLPDWAKEFDAATWAQFFLKFLLGNEKVTVVIPGTGNADHMIDNLGAARGRLPDAQQRERMVALLTS
jgi:aryl-alcohol dehydrogenase-like predicted oxidoreductase